MAKTKGDHIWSYKIDNRQEQKIGEKVAEILREEYTGRASPMKNISLKTGISPDTIRKWYSGRKTPYLEHFLILAQNYPAILRMFLEATGHDYLVPHIRPQEQGSRTTEQLARPVKPQSEVENSFHIHIDISPRIASALNHRQLWFLGILQQYQQAKAAAICVQWPSITNRTARNDVAKLVKMNLVRLVGSKKSGLYKMR
jgi:hypothetical protein